MELIREILKFLFRAAIALFVAALIWWLIAILYPRYSARNLLSSMTSTTTTSWLPDPRAFKGLLGKNISPDGTSNVYTPPPEYNGFGNAYNNNQGGAPVAFVTYTSSGTEILYNGEQGVFNSNTVGSGSNTETNATYIRNLSIYQGGHVYTGLTFTGEARNIMFKNGQFPVVVTDLAGNALAITSANATTNWSTPGWVRFQVKVTSVLPNKIQCNMVFQSGNAIANNQPVRATIPIVCN